MKELREEAGFRNGAIGPMIHWKTTGPIGRVAVPTVMLAALSASACAGPGGGPEPGTGPAGEEIWASLERERPSPLPGAPRIAVSEIVPLGGEPDSDLPEASGGVRAPVAVGLQEMVSLGLIRRRDVHFVERRRFGPAAELEGRGVDRPAGAPPAGISPGAEMVLSGTWSPVAADSAYLDLRLAEAATGRVLASWRTATPRDAQLVSLARTAVGGLVSALGGMDRKPDWTDPLTGSDRPVAPSTYRDAGIGGSATAAFLRGLAAEDRYDWEAARIGYQRALREAGGAFFEADQALARAARLRAGGTLGES